MKTKNVIKCLLLVIAIGMSFVSCKKDKNIAPAAVPAQTISFTDLKKLSTGASVKVPDAKKITGIVISDISNKNIDAKTVILQEATGKPGIVITFDAAQTFAAGDQVEVNISNQVLAQVNGEIQLTNIPSANAKKTGTGTIVPAITNAADVIKNATALAATLVTLPAGNLSGGNGEYSGALTYTDSTGTVQSDVLAGAVFENTGYPASSNSYTGIVRINGSKVTVDIPNTTNVPPGAIKRLVTIDFQDAKGGNVDPAVPSFLTPDYAGTIKTATSDWGNTINGTNLCWLFPGSQFDGDFTSSGRKYLYLGYGDDPNLNNGGKLIDFSYNSLPYTTLNLAGLKTVSVTFAGSKVSGKGVLPASASLTGVPSFDVLPFNPATDFIQVGLTFSPLIPGNGDFATFAPALIKLTKLSPKITQLGQFYTLTWTIPTQAELTAAGLGSDQVAAVLDNPDFTIINTSHKAAGANPQGAQLTPVLIDKVVLGFSK